MILLHGFTGWPSSWDAVVAALAAPATALAVAGHHPDLPPPASFEAEVDRLAALIPPGSHVAGYSLGARLALGIANRHPGVVSRLTLFGVHPGLDDEHARQARRSDDERWAELLLRDGIDVFCDAWEAQPLFSAPRPSRRLHRADWLAATLRALSLGAMPVYRLPAIPTLVVAGARDDKFCRLARELAGERARIIPGAGHDLLSEAPFAVADCLQGAIS